MNRLRLYTIILLPLLFNFSAIQAQNNDNLNVIQQVYLQLQDQNAFSKDITALITGVQWEKTANYNRNKISLQAILNKEWDNILFEDLIFLNGNNEVEVTGTVSGRQPAECEYITSRFKHSWTIKDGKILAFIE